MKMKTGSVGFCVESELLQLCSFLLKWLDIRKASQEITPNKIGTWSWNETAADYALCQSNCCRSLWPSWTYYKFLLPNSVCRYCHTLKGRLSVLQIGKKQVEPDSSNSCSTNCLHYWKILQNETFLVSPSCPRRFQQNSVRNIFFHFRNIFHIVIGILVLL